MGLHNDKNRSNRITRLIRFEKLKQLPLSVNLKNLDVKPDLFPLFRLNR